jgi:hypothetical protein
MRNGHVDVGSHRSPIGPRARILILCLAAFPAAAPASYFGPNVRVNHFGDGYYQSHPSVPVGPDGTIYAVWEDAGDLHNAIYCARSVDGGATFEEEVRVDGAQHFLLGWPEAAVDGLGRVFVVWVDWQSGETGRVRCARSCDQGVSFEEPVLVSDVTTGDRYWPAIAGIPSGGCYVVWGDFRNGEDVIDVYFSRSSNGLAFTPNVKANLAPVGPTCTPPLPKVAAGDLPGLVHIVWRQTLGEGDRYVYATRSLNGGDGFQPAVEVSHTPWVYLG